MPLRVTDQVVEILSSEDEAEPDQAAIQNALPSKETLLELLTYRPPFARHVENARGAQLVGRKISVMWTDGKWFDAVVVCFYARRGKYRIVYPIDGSIELIRLEPGRWRLYPKERPGWGMPDLVGATVQFMHPEDEVVYRAIVFKVERGQNRIHVAYLRERVIDTLCGGEWAVIKDTPCVDR